LATLQVLNLAIERLGELTDTKIEALHNELVKADDAIREVVNGQFESIDRRFAQIESQRLEQKHDTAAAVDATLQAQKDATAKSEVAISKQLAALETTFDHTIDGLRRTIDDLKDRLSEVRRSVDLGPPALPYIQQAVSENTGRRIQGTEARTFAFALIAAVVGAAGLLLAIIAFASRR
jgi:ribosome-associated translation inhibitor RaiA